MARGGGGGEGAGRREGAHGKTSKWEGGKRGKGKEGPRSRRDDSAGGKKAWSQAGGYTIAESGRAVSPVQVIPCRPLA